MDLNAKREKEKELVSYMIALYCRKKHSEKKGLCPACTDLTRYARARSDSCPFMATKTFCVNCKVHCYSAKMRQKMRDVMRYSGPRLVFTRPLAALHHLIAVKQERKFLKNNS